MMKKEIVGESEPASTEGHVVREGKEEHAIGQSKCSLESQNRMAKGLARASTTKRDIRT